MGREKEEKVVVPQQPAISRQLQYREQLIKWNPYSLKNLALCYEFRTGPDTRSVRIVPDACVDFLFRLDLDHPAAIVEGAQVSPTELEVAPNTLYFGFKPYSSKGMCSLRTGWAELCGHRVPMEEQLPASGILERMTQAETFDQRVSAVREFALGQLADKTYQPDFVEFAELRLCRAKGNLRIDDLSDFTGYSGRYCRAKFKEAHGISIKHYSDIMRVQNAVRMLSGGADIQDVVFENGYFDQPHLNREFRFYTCETPLRYLQTVRKRA